MSHTTINVIVGGSKRAGVTKFGNSIYAVDFLTDQGEMRTIRTEGNNVSVVNDLIQTKPRMSGNDSFLCTVGAITVGGRGTVTKFTPVTTELIHGTSRTIDLDDERIYFLIRHDYDFMFKNPPRVA